ncbi:MAG: hypothetical protein NVS2B16_08080 [Chloroflexota bacterium]
MSVDRRRMSGEYLPLRDAMERLFEGSFISPQSFGGQGTYPPADLFVTDDDVIVELAVPGASQDDLSISVTGDTVTLSGEVKRTHDRDRGQLHVQEIWQGKFQRSFRLPIQVDADKANASFECGVLTLRLPKAETTRPRKIQIGAQKTVSNQAPGTIEGHVQKEKTASKTS